MVMRRFVNPTFIILLFLMVGMNIADGNFSDIGEWFFEKILALPAIIIGLSFHEFGHAAAAYKLGDNTPELQGRVTVNPMSHIDPFGFLFLMVAGFGWGIPVQINPANFKNPRRDELIVSAAGVTVNLILAVAATGIMALLYKTVPDLIAQTYMGYVAEKILINIIFINLILMVFNLLPIPPLDGFGILTEVFDLRKYDWYYPLYEKGFLILMVLIMLNLTDKIITPIITFVFTGIVSIFF